MTTKVDEIWRDFLGNRIEDLAKRFPGWHRAEVVETNDPLRDHRVRFRMPEMHDKSLEAEKCPWAIPSPTMGGKRAGFWPGVCKGDFVFINFEKGHPYGPIWSPADPTRRKFYALESIYGRTQLSVNEKGEPADAPDDYDEERLPKDERPMSTGFKDRYGNIFMMGAVGFFPKEHANKPAPTGTDPVTEGAYKASQKPPEENKPDMKFMVQMSKYGNYMIVADIGYKWKNEFDGDFEKDEDFEIKRVKYIQKMFSENETDGVDQRRMEMRTRFGHKFEMRDVGWKKSRPEEFDQAVDLTDAEGKNEKEQMWIRAITKDGTYLRMWSKGADLEKNNFIKRLNKSDVGTKPYDEDQYGDGQGDCRGFYICTPRQQIFSIDDAGADPKDPQNNERPYPNGIFLGGWRDGHYYGMEYNLKDELQRMMLYTSTGHALELNQRHDYVALSTKPPQTVARKFDGPYKRTPFSLKTLKGQNIEGKSFHVVLDEKNKYLRVKTPKGQGIEARDGEGDPSCGGTWVETRDSEDRGFWMSKENNFAVWRGKKQQKYICINDSTDYIVIRNGLKSVQIFAQKDIEMIAGGNVQIKAGGNFDVSAGGAINLKGAVVNAGPTLKTMNMYMQTRCGGHPAVYIPRHIAGTAKCGGSPSPGSPSPMQCKPVKPEDFDKERGCDPTKPQKGPVPSSVVHCGPGQGNSNSSPPSMDPETGDNPDVFNPDTGGDPGIVNTPSSDPPGPADPVVDPLDPFAPGTGILWFGTSSLYEDDISQNGLNRLALSNPMQNPDDPALYIPLSKTQERAEGEQFAETSVQKYGGDKLIYRIVAVDNGEALEQDPDDQDVVQYRDDNIRPEYIELFDRITS